MKLVNIHGAGDIRLDEAPDPVPGPRDVLLRIDACGLCGSDLTFARIGLQRGDGPWPLGHEAAGTVVAVGADVAAFAPGARVVVNPMGAADNVIGCGGSEGALATLLLVRDPVPGRHLLSMPPGMTAERAALVEPFGVALHGVRQGRVSPSDQVAVFGAGPIGLAATFWLARAGVRSIVSIDLSDDRLALARRMGATDCINPSRVDLVAALSAIHGAAPPVLGQPAAATDLFIDMAGGPGVMDGIIRAARFGARIVLTAVYPAPVPLDLQTMLLKELSLFTAVGYPDELPSVLDTLAEASDAAIAAYTTHRFAFADILSAFDAARTPASGKVMVLFE